MAELSIQKRTEESSNMLRKSGKVPGIIYGTKEPQKITLDGKQLSKVYGNPSYYTSIIKLVDDGKEEDVLAKDVQLHPVKDTIVHADFMRISKGMRIRIRVPVHFINEEKSSELKHGGVLNIIAHTLEVQCSPYEIPEEFVYDLTGATSHDPIVLDKLTLPEGVAPVHPERDRILATIVSPSSIEEEKGEGEDGQAQAIATESDKT